MIFGRSLGLENLLAFGGILGLENLLIFGGIWNFENFLVFCGSVGVSVRGAVGVSVGGVVGVGVVVVVGGVATGGRGVGENEKFGIFVGVVWGGGGRENGREGGVEEVEALYREETLIKGK